MGSARSDLPLRADNVDSSGRGPLRALTPPASLRFCVLRALASAGLGREAN